MKMREDIRPVTYFKSRAAGLLRQLNETRRPVIITQSGKPRAVLQDPESYERMKTAIGLMKLIVQAEENLRSRRTYSQEVVFERLSKQLLAAPAEGAKKAKI